MPDQINASPYLQRYLDVLPSGEYCGKCYQVVATDGSSRPNQSSTKEHAMGAGVIWHGAAIPHRSKRVGGQHSSTLAELAAVVMALQGTPHADDLAILIDSAAAIQRLQWFQSHDF
jgi:ribonuclease HI